MTQFATDLAIAIIIGNTVSALIIGVSARIFTVWRTKVRIKQQIRQISQVLQKLADTNAMETDVNKH